MSSPVSPSKKNPSTRPNVGSNNSETINSLTTVQNPQSARIAKKVATVMSATLLAAITYYYIQQSNIDLSQHAIEVLNIAKPLLEQVFYYLKNNATQDAKNLVALANEMKTNYTLGTNAIINTQPSYLSQQLNDMIFLILAGTYLKVFSVFANCFGYKKSSRLASISAFILNILLLNSIINYVNTTISTGGK